MYATFNEDIMAEKKKNAHYVDNKKLLAAMIEFRNSVIEAKENDKPRPRIPDYIGECIMKISEHLSYRPNFINYTYKDEMKLTVDSVYETLEGAVYLQMTAAIETCGLHHGQCSDQPHLHCVGHLQET